MKVYIAGPMSGLPGLNFAAFDQAAQDLRAYGYQPINPADLDRAAGFDPDVDIPSPAFMRSALGRDLAAICQCAGVAVLPGWKSSLGALVEVSLAVRLGLRILETDDMVDITEEVTAWVRSKLDM